MRQGRMNMELVEVNQQRCTKCEICVQICPPKILAMGENGPAAISPQVCIACGHCVAVCPHKAIDNRKTPLVNQPVLKEFPVVNAETAEQFLRSRRSVRCYKDTVVPREDLQKLLEIARFAPTASNRQGVSYIIIEDKEKLKMITAVMIEWMEEQTLNNPAHHWSFPLHINAYREKGIDNILHDAPHLILATTQKNLPKGRENTIFSLTYLELFATALGLGSCWAGLLEMCIFANYQPLLDLINIPQDKEITGAVMVGYPKYNFKRLVDRDPLDVTWL